MIKLLLLSIVAVGLSSCAGTGPTKGLKEPKISTNFTAYVRGEPSWETMDDVRKDLGDKVKISGTTVDLQGGRISGNKLKKPSNSQSENAIGIKIRIKNLTIKNGVIDNLYGGLICYAEDITFQNLTFISIGEDAISNLKDISKGTRVINCKFYGNSASDKILQGNDGRDFYVRGNLISSAITGIRVQKKNAQRQGGTAQVIDNQFIGVDTAVNAAGEVRVIVKGNTFEKVREKYKTDSDKVKFIEE